MNNEEKFKKTAAKFRANLGFLKEQKRKTIILGDEYKERIIEGKRTRLQVISQQQSQPAPSQQQIHQQQHSQQSQSAPSQQQIHQPQQQQQQRSQQSQPAPSQQQIHQQQQQQQQRPPQQLKLTEQLHCELDPILIYPAGKGGYTLYQHDVARLQDGQFMNDTIINIYLAWIATYLEGAALVRVVDSQWFSQITRGIALNDMDLETLKQNAHRMRKWFPNGHPFDRSLVVVPVCAEQHWVVITIMQIEGKVVLTLFDSLQSQMGKQAEAALKSIVQYFRPTSEVITESIRVRQQQNLFDCGLHVVQNSTKVIAWITQIKESNWEELQEYMLDERHIISREVLKMWVKAMTDQSAVPPAINDLIEGVKSPMNHYKHLSPSDTTNDDKAWLYLPPDRETLLTTGWTVKNHKTEMVILDDEEVNKLTEEVERAKTDLQNSGKKVIRFRRLFAYGKVVFRIKKNTTYCKIAIQPSNKNPEVL